MLTEIFMRKKGLHELYYCNKNGKREYIKFKLKERLDIDR